MISLLFVMMIDINHFHLRLLMLDGFTLLEINFHFQKLIESKYQIRIRIVI